MFHYSVKDGLPSKEVHFIFEDSRNYIWICTDAGLVKYNANTFKVFDSSDGMPDNTVFEVLEDEHHRIWYRTFLGGIGYISNDSVYAIAANKKIVELQGKGLLISFCVKSDGTVVMGKQGVDECAFIQVKPPYSENDVIKVPSLHISRLGIDGIIFKDRIVFAEKRIVGANTNEIGFRYYKFLLHDQSGKIIVHDSISRKRSNALSKFYVNGSEILFLNRYSLIKYNLASGKKLFDSLTTEMLCAFDENDKIIIGQRKDGITEYKLKSLQNNESTFLNGRSITSIEKDSYGGYWFGTLEEGVYYCPDRNYYKWNVFEFAEPENHITDAQMIDDSVFVIATKKGTVQVLKLQQADIKTKVLFTVKKNAEVMRMHWLNNRKFFLNRDYGMNTSLVVLDKTTSATPLNEGYAFKKTGRAGKYYVGLITKEIILMDSVSMKPIRNIEIGDRGNSFAFDPVANAIYVAGMHGLYYLSFRTERELVLKTASVRTEDVLLYNSHIYAATKSHGLLVGQNGKYDTIDSKAGLLSDICRKLFLIGNEVWVLTNRGFSALKYDGYRNFTVRNYPFTGDFFPETIDNIFYVNGKLSFFSGSQFYSYPIYPPKNKQSFRVKRMFVNNRIVATADKLLLKHDQSNISVDFEALFFNMNRGIQYRYKFEGMDSVWNYTQKPNVNFLSLSPGNYILRLQAKNLEDVWVNCEQTPVIVIAKPFWTRLWFIALEIALGIFVVALVLFKRYKKAIRAEREKNLRNSMLMEFEIKALRAQMNPHFISNSLAAIQEIIYNKEVEKAAQYLARFSFFMRQVLNNSDKMYTTLKEEIEMLTLNIELEQLRFKDNFDFELSVAPDLDIEEIQIPSLITQTFLENAIWHGLLPLKDLRKPKLKISIFQRDEFIFIEIEDNGVGRGSKRSNSQSKGIKLVTNKLESINKLTNTNNYKLEVLDLSDENGSALGTRVILQLASYVE
jgi:hypothetical protein